MTITLEAIKAEQDKVAAMIAAFEAKAKAEAAYPITVALPELNPGERYLGAILSADGSKRHHVILLPGDNDDVPFESALEWAKSIGGDLPNRIEQAMQFTRSQSASEREALRLRQALASLSPREREVLDQLILGHYNKNIADHLGITQRTVEFHRANIFEKMGVESAIELAHKLGRLEPMPGSDSK